MIRISPKVSIWTQLRTRPEIHVSGVLLHLPQQTLKQECLPVGCASLTSVTVSPARTPPALSWMPPGHMWPLWCMIPRYTPPLPHMSSSLCPCTAPLPPVNRQTPVKTLPLHTSFAGGNKLIRYRQIHSVISADKLALSFSLSIRKQIVESWNTSLPQAVLLWLHAKTSLQIAELICFLYHFRVHVRLGSLCNWTLKVYSHSVSAHAIAMSTINGFNTYLYLSIRHRERWEIKVPHRYRRHLLSVTVPKGYCVSHPPTSRSENGWCNFQVERVRWDTEIRVT